MICYLYNGQTYYSAYTVKQAIFENERLAFGAEPLENRERFWEQFGVQYQEIEDPPPEPKSIDEVRQEKLDQLQNKFNLWYNDRATVITSLGYTVDADTTAAVDVAGLITTNESRVFNDANNMTHDVTSEDLQLIRTEIEQARQAARQQKWDYRTAILAAETIEQIQQIKIKFVPMDFSTNAE